MINERLIVLLLTFMHLWVCFLPIIKHCFHLHTYLYLFYRLMILLSTFMHIRVFSYDWWYCSWLLCRFAKSAVAPNARARSLSQFQHIQHFHLQEKRKMHIDYWTSCHKNICFNWPFLYSSCCNAYKEIYIRKTKDLKAFRLLQTWNPLWCCWNLPYFTIFGNWPHICRSTLECPHTFSNNLYFLSTTTLDADCSSSQLFFTINSILPSQLLFSAQYCLAIPFCNISPKPLLYFPS